MEYKKENSIIRKKAYDFAVEIVKAYKRLSSEKREFILSKQLLRSGTSIGANVNEALSGESKRDFVHKLNISLKEARETNYWLSLLKDSDFISEIEFTQLHNTCQELEKILSKIIVTTKERYLQK